MDQTKAEDEAALKNQADEEAAKKKAEDMRQEAMEAGMCRIPTTS